MNIQDYEFLNLVKTYVSKNPTVAAKISDYVDPLKGK